MDGKEHVPVFWLPGRGIHGLPLPFLVPIVALHLGTHMGGRKLVLVN